MNKLRLWTLGLGVGFLLTSFAMIWSGSSYDLFWLMMTLLGVTFVVVELGNFTIEKLAGLHNELRRSAAKNEELDV